MIKKWIPSSLLLLMLMLFSPLRGDFISGYEVISLEEMSEESSDMFFSGQMPRTVLACHKDAILPLRISLKGDCLSLQEGPLLSMKVLETCYIRCIQGYFFVSQDLENWSESVNFFSGGLELYLGIDKNLLQVVVELNLAKKEAALVTE